MRQDLQDLLKIIETPDDETQYVAARVLQSIVMHDEVRRTMTPAQRRKLYALEQEEFQARQRERKGIGIRSSVSRNEAVRAIFTARASDRSRMAATIVPFTRARPALPGRP